MPGKNFGVCHSCREKVHFFSDCSKKQRCPWCKIDFVKCFEVEKETENKGKLFNCCSAKCKYWEWVDKGESSCGSSSVTMNANNHAAVQEDEHISRLFQTRCRVSEEQALEIQFTVTIRKVNESTEVDKKGKRPA